MTGYTLTLEKNGPVIRRPDGTVVFSFGWVDQARARVVLARLNAPRIVRA